MNRKGFYLAIMVIIIFDIVYLGYFRHRRKDYAELIIHGGRIVTIDALQPEVEALAMSNGRLTAVGTLREVMKKAGPKTRFLDLKGALAVPGLIESHGHFLSLGESLTTLDLGSARNWEEVTAMVAAKAAKAPPGEWIEGRGWHQDKWDRRPEPNVEGLPLHDALSASAPNNPVVLSHASGHFSLVNAKAMEISGITAATPDPAGGRILRDASGRPTGALLETAQDLLKRTAGIETVYDRQHRWENQALAAARECLAHGITTFEDAGSSYDQIDVFKNLARDKRLPIRLWVMIGESNQAIVMRGRAYRLINFWDYHLTVRAIKRYMDGAMGDRGAWLLKPYEDMPGTSGLNVSDVKDLDGTAALALRFGFQLCIHAIGDRANREVLDLYERAFKNRKTELTKFDYRWRIEHAQHLSPADMPRFKQLGVVAAMQGIHCTSDGPWIISRIGRDRAAEGAYVWRKLLDRGVVVCNGTDVPVEREDPIACFYASVTRKLKDGTYFFPEERMTREEALRSYTINGAYAAFEDGLKGSFVKGKLADVTVLSKDILTCPDDDILRTEVLYTIVGGKILYSKEGASTGPAGK